MATEGIVKFCVVTSRASSRTLQWVADATRRGDRKSAASATTWNEKKLEAEHHHTDLERKKLMKLEKT